jgi:methylphosphotriester-DNA--protein-cysteine methyltransferase
MRRLDRIVRKLAGLRRESAPDRLVQTAMRQLEFDPTLRAGALARRLAVSERQLRRRFEAETGLGVKRMSRILRFQRLMGRIRSRQSGPVRWADLAGDLGYADQAHLIHETRLMSGLSPLALENEIRASRSVPTST